MAPDGNGTFEWLEQPRAFNDLRQTSFLAGMAGTSGGDSDDLGVFRGIAGSVTLIARGGQPVPDGNGTFGDWAGRQTLNASGQVAFHFKLAGRA